MPRRHSLTSMLTAWASLLAGTLAARANEGGTWAPAPSMSIARQETGVARVGDRIYVVGGLVDGPSNTTNTVEVYDITTATWSLSVPLPVTLHHAACAALNGLVYVTGGYRSGFSPEEETFVFDPVAGTWSAGDDLPERRGAGWMVAHDGRLYHFGGLGPSGATATTFVYEPGVGWTEAASMPTPREHTNAVFLDGYLYVIGGRAGSSTDANERYHPETDTWETRAAMPTARSAMATAALGGVISCAGGEIPQLYAVHEVYDPVTNTWDCREPMAIPRHGVAAIALADHARIFVPGGGVVQGLEPTAEVDVFIPPGVVSVGPVAGAPGSRRIVVRAAPDPFTDETVLRVSASRAGGMTLVVLDATGRSVRVLARENARPGRPVVVTWDGRDDAGRDVAPGAYFVTAQGSGGLVAARRVIRLPD